MSLGGKASDWEPGASYSGVSREEEKSWITVFLIFLTSKNAKLIADRWFRGCTWCVYVRARARVCAGQYGHTALKKKSGNLICHSEKQFNFLTCGVDWFFWSAWMCGRKQAFLYWAPVLTSISLCRRVWNHLGYLESQTVRSCFVRSSNRKELSKIMNNSVPLNKEVILLKCIINV